MTRFTSASNIVIVVTQGQVQQKSTNSSLYCPEFNTSLSLCLWSSVQGAVVSLNATLGLGTSGHLQDTDTDGGGFTEYTYDETEGGQPGFSLGRAYEGDEYQEEDEGVEYTGDQNCENYQDEVLELQIDEPLDDDFQVSNAFSCYLYCLHTLSVIPHHISSTSAAWHILWPPGLKVLFSWCPANPCWLMGRALRQDLIKLSVGEKIIDLL